MIIEELRLRDFRCFYGESSISFSSDPERNVTIIYAENGVGKTTLLNAFLWCLYGEMTARFEKKEDLLNYDAQKEGRTQASVEVVFENNGNRYIAKRFARSSTGMREGRDFVVHRFDRGSQIPIDFPDTFINTVVPREMAPHFLFDGEHAEVFLGEANKNSIQSAVRDILGCSLIEAAVEDLTAVSNMFRKQIPATSATSRISELSRRVDTLLVQEQEAQQALGDLERKKTEIRNQIDDIDEKLRNSAAAKELARSRDRVMDQMRKAERRQREHLDEVYRWLGENGRYIVSKRITEETFEFLDERDQRGRIPSPYNEEFVKEILAAETCICGQHLAPGSEHAERVAALLNKAANQVMRDRITRVRGRLSNLKNERKKAPAKLELAQQRLADANDDYTAAEAQLADIHERLKDVKLDHIAEREQRREELRREVSGLDQKIGARKAGVTAAERERRDMEVQIDQLARQDKQTAIYAKRRSLCEAVKGTLERQLVEEEVQARRMLQNSIRKILQATTRKPLTLRMNESYLISLVNSDGLTLPKSSGENQLLGLAFTAALVEFAKLRRGAQDFMLLPGTIAPLVLDSPFGQLDEAYRATTAEFIPKMAEQVILMVSRSQGSKEVLEALQPHLGAEYILVRHNKGTLGDRKVESRDLKGRQVQTAFFDSSFDGTEIKEVASI